MITVSGHKLKPLFQLFPGLIYRMIKPKVVLLIFVSGKIVLTGAKVINGLSIQSCTVVVCAGSRPVITLDDLENALFISHSC